MQKTSHHIHSHHPLPDYKNEFWKIENLKRIKTEAKHDEMEWIPTTNPEVIIVEELSMKKTFHIDKHLHKPKLNLENDQIIQTEKQLIAHHQSTLNLQASYLVNCGNLLIARIRAEIMHSTLDAKGENYAYEEYLQVLKGFIKNELPKKQSIIKEIKLHASDMQKWFLINNKHINIRHFITEPQILKEHL